MGSIKKSTFLLGGGGPDNKICRDLQKSAVFLDRGSGLILGLK